MTTRATPAAACMGVPAVNEDAEIVIRPIRIEACEQALHAQGIGIVAALVEKENPTSARLLIDAGYVTDVPVHYFRKRTRPDI